MSSLKITKNSVQKIFRTKKKKNMFYFELDFLFLSITNFVYKFPSVEKQVHLLRSFRRSLLRFLGLHFCFRHLKTTIIQ